MFYLRNPVINTSKFITFIFRAPFKLDSTVISSKFISL